MFIDQVCFKIYQVKYLIYWLTCHCGMRNDVLASPKKDIQAEKSQ